MIQPIVEGKGEIEAVPLLCRRFLDALGAYQVKINRPIKRNRHQLIDHTELSKSIEIALEQPNCQAILILFDADGDCPKKVVENLKQKAIDFSRGTPCEVVVACQEYESWFLASLESLRDKCGISPMASYDGEPELPRGAKSHLEQWMELGYSPPIDQAKLTAAFDMKTTYRKCRSFRRMVKAFGDLISKNGIVLPCWPPRDWVS